MSEELLVEKEIKEILKIDNPLRVRLFTPELIEFLKKRLKEREEGCGT